ncbi:MAG: caspase family protein [Cyanobacteria bacterium P01_H01_bin.162]
MLGRRDFLQRLSAALAVLGITDMTLAGWSAAYQTALAESNRCLAVLIGINAYPAGVRQADPVERSAFLQGALMDVELQRELLISRFGVLPSNIVTLTNDTATVNQILETIQGHLVAQAKPGDTVVVHFSGLGGQVQLSSGAATTGRLPTLVAVDSQLPSTASAGIQDLFEESVAQLLRGLKGVKVLTVIDAGTVAHPTLLRGNFRVRSRLVTPMGAWQAPFDTRLTEPHQPLDQLATSWPGYLLRAGLTGTPVLEGSWKGFSAGLFTYALTQQLWTSLPAQKQQWFIYNVDRKLSVWTGTHKSPQLRGKQASKKTGLPLLSGRLPQPAAHGVIQTIDTPNRTATLWLGGLPTILLPYCDLGLQLQPLPTLPQSTALPQGTLTVKALAGLQAKADLMAPQDLSVGVPLVEIERRFPKEIVLTIALDPILERIELVDATSALAGLPYIMTTAPGEKPVDCVFGKGSFIRRSVAQLTADEETSAANQSEDAVAPSAQPGYALFNPEGSLIAGTAAEDEEAVKTAVSRLHGALRSLLAVKMLRLTVNAIASQLPLRLTLETRAPNGQLWLLEETLRSRQLASADSTNPQRLSPTARALSDRDEPTQLCLLNSGAVRLYYLIISVADNSRLSVYCPPASVSEGSEPTSSTIAEASRLPARQVVVFPQLQDSAFSLQPLPTMAVFAIAATHPFTETWKAIRTPEFRPLIDQWSTVPEPLEMAKALFNDLSYASAQSADETSEDTDPLTVLRSSAWATLPL